jgi:hypothetical protein
MKVFNFTDACRHIFPNSIVIDSALLYPITDKGWDIEMPDREDIGDRFDDADFKLIFNLQDHLTTKSTGMVGDGFVFYDIPLELAKIRNFYKGWAPSNQIIVVVWPLGLVDAWPKHEFHLVEFSSHQYETWLYYKSAEGVLREAFSYLDKDFEYNFLCMNRIEKPHRKILYSKLASMTSGNISLQSAGHELKYPGLDFVTYDRHYDNLSNLLSIKRNFQTSMFSLVTETQYHERFGIITEKTLNAIVAGHPFIVAGHHGCLDDIKSLGFKTYPTIFNEEYQYFENDERIDAILDLNGAYFTRITTTALHDLVDEHRDIIDYNRDYFFDSFGPDRLEWFRTQLLNIWE